MNKNTDLLAVGHTALDYIIKVKEFPKANFSAPIQDMKTFDGGTAANVALVGATLGLSTSLVSAVGGDFLRSDYYNKMKDLNVDTDSLIVVKEESTPTAFVLTNDNNDQISYFYWGAAKEFQNNHAPKKAIQKTKAIHLATGDPNFNWKCGQAAREEDILVSFDPGQDLGMYTPERLKGVISNTNILFGNHHEIERILDTLELDIEGLKELGPEIVIKTCGALGSEIYSKEDKIQIDAVKCESLDPTGAGDSYRAGFLSRFINGESIEKSGKFASTVSSFIVESTGCQTNIPTFDEVYERMDKFY